MSRQVLFQSQFSSRLNVQHLSRVHLLLHVYRHVFVDVICVLLVRIGSGVSGIGSHSNRVFLICSSVHIFALQRAFVQRPLIPFKIKRKLRANVFSSLLRVFSLRKLKRVQTFFTNRRVRVERRHGCRRRRRRRTYIRRISSVTFAINRPHPRGHLIMFEQVDRFRFHRM